jgi:glucose-1-phosphate thymidylyltransferase
MRKGIILAGGLGTRLFPLTSSISKQILPIYDKPMIYYPLSNLIMSGINEILIISSPEHIKLYKKLLRDGSSIGLNIKYKIQKKPNGIAEALILAEGFLDGADMCLILGDNIFFGKNFKEKLISAYKSKNQSIFVKRVDTPEKYGVLKFHKSKPVKIIEKPKKFISDYAVTGIYFYNNDSIKIAKKIKPSKRNEKEISELNQILLSQRNLKVIKLGKEVQWRDAGDHNEYLTTCIDIKNYETKYKIILGSIEYESIKKKFLKKSEFVKNIFNNNFYYKKVLKFLK